MSVALYNRQNDTQAMQYIRAAEYCANVRRALAYTLITLSISLTAFSIFNKFLPMMTQGAYSLDLSSHIAEILVLVSGIFMVTQIIVNFFIHQMEAEWASILEKYDVYVLRIPENQALIRPITDGTIENYKARIRKYGHLFNYYYDDPAKIDGERAYLDRVTDFFKHEYRILLNIKPWLTAMWISFPVLIFVLAFAINLEMQTTIIQMFIPALSTIGLIASSWHSHYWLCKYVQNAINTCEGYARDYKNGILPIMAVRSLQDAVLSYRKICFFLPNSLIKAIDKRWEARETQSQSLPPPVLLPVQKKRANNIPPALAKDDSPTPPIIRIIEGKVTPVVVAQTVDVKAKTVPAKIEPKVEPKPVPPPPPSPAPAKVEVKPTPTPAINADVKAKVAPVKIEPKVEAKPVKVEPKVEPKQEIKAKPIEKPIEKPIVKPIEKPVEKSIEKPIEKPKPKTGGK